MDLIDRDAAIKAVATELAFHSYAGNIAANAIKSVPSAEKRGKWVGVSPMVDTLMCSECGGNIIDEEFKTPYCPYCGAKMESEE